MEAIMENTLNQAMESHQKEEDDPSVYPHRRGALTGTVCSCSCHCTLSSGYCRRQHPPSSESSSASDDDDTVRSRYVNGRRRRRPRRCRAVTNATSMCVAGVVTRRAAKHRHYSADHVRCLLRVDPSSSSSAAGSYKPMASSIKHVQCKSSDLVAPVCEACGCKTYLLPPSASHPNTDDIRHLTAAVVGSTVSSSPSYDLNRTTLVTSSTFSSQEQQMAPAALEIYDKKAGRFLEPLTTTTTDVRRPSSCYIRQSSSDPTLSSIGDDDVSGNRHPPDTSHLTNIISTGFSFATLTRKSKALLPSTNNMPSLSKFTSGYNGSPSLISHTNHHNNNPASKKYNSLSRLNRRNLSFRIPSLRKLSTRKLGGQSSSESICPPAPGNVKLSAINKLNNNVSLAELKEKMDVGNHPPPVHSTVPGCKLITSRPWSNKLIDTGMTASLRRRKKSFLEKYSGSHHHAKVSPEDCASYHGGSLLHFNAWNDEYEGQFDELHHANCPCRHQPTNKQLKDEMADVTAEMETLEGGEDGKNNPKSKQMSIGRKKFNMDPKKGIEYLIEHGLLKNTADDIAKFLYNGEGLSKTAIGDYLGERHDFNQTVLDSFVTLHDFTDLILVQALRQFLWSFRLPGEAQKIDRMMERFAHHYCELNPSIFQHPDTCFVLSFAIIMLNTSLHNPAVRDRDKQTLEQFINMNRGIDNGNDLPRELLESLYESIKTEPFKIPEDDGNDLMHTFFNPDREGWLWKQGGRYKSWKRRWFILNDNCLYYFEYTTDKEPRGIIPLENIEVREVHDRNKPHCFELYATSTDFIKACKTDSEGKVVEGKHTVYRMSASTHEEKEDWIKCIRQSISHNPFYDLLAKRKKNIQKNSS